MSSTRVEIIVTLSFQYRKRRNLFEIGSSLLVIRVCVHVCVFINYAKFFEGKTIENCSIF